MRAQATQFHNNGRLYKKNIVKSALLDFEWQLFLHLSYFLYIWHRHIFSFFVRWAITRGLNVDTDQRIETWLQNTFETKPDIFWRNTAQY